MGSKVLVIVPYKKKWYIYSLAFFCAMAHSANNILCRENNQRSNGRGPVLSLSHCSFQAHLYPR